MKTIGEMIVYANFEGNITFLQQMADEGQFDPLRVTLTEQWNYLHGANMLNPSPKETIQFYLDRGVEVNAQDCYGMTPLHYAVREHNYDAVKLLLEAGADPNIDNQDGANSLWQAFLKIPLEKDIPIIKLLIEYGADPFKKNMYDVAVIEPLKRNAKRRPYLISLVDELEASTAPYSGNH